MITRTINQLLSASGIDPAAPVPCRQIVAAAAAKGHFTNIPGRVARLIAPTTWRNTFTRFAGLPGRALTRPPLALKTILTGAALLYSPPAQALNPFRISTSTHIHESNFDPEFCLPAAAVFLIGIFFALRHYLRAQDILQTTPRDGGADSTGAIARRQTARLSSERAQPSPSGSTKSPRGTGPIRTKDLPEPLKITFGKAGYGDGDVVFEPVSLGYIHLRVGNQSYRLQKPPQGEIPDYLDIGFPLHGPLRVTRVAKETASSISGSLWLIKGKQQEMYDLGNFAEIAHYILYDDATEVAIDVTSDVKQAPLLSQVQPGTVFGPEADQIRAAMTLLKIANDSREAALNELRTATTTSAGIKAIAEIPISP